MFKRRKPRRWYERLREMLWPSAGWRRTVQYYGYRVTRIPGTSYSIAAGLATGAGLAFTPFLGLHLAIAMAIAWVIRANLLAAAIGTLIGNPWTYPFLWLLTYQTGLAMLGLHETVSITDVLKDFNLLESPLEAIKPVLLPLLVGSIPYAVVMWVLVYFPTKKIIQTRKRKILAMASYRHEQIAKKLKELK